MVNNLTAKNVEEQLLAVSLPAHTTMIESLSATGKIAGNGNGMQFFGAMLIRSELTLDELSAYYSQKPQNAVVKEQNGQVIACATNRSLSFAASVSDSENYYIVYLFGSGIHPFSDLDLRGH